MRRSRKKKVLLWTVLVLLMGISLGIGFFWYQREKNMQFVKKLGAGYNLGNSLDVYQIKERKPEATVTEYETAWGNAPASPELMKALCEAGFSTVRIPVSWGEHLDEEDRIDPLWMERVTQVVDDAMEAGLYVILNTHHEPWIVPVKEEEEEVTRRLCAIWEQIAARFSDYDERLLFESMNEPRLRDSKYEWTSGTTELRTCVNELNEAFVKTIRAAEGKNKTRWLLLPAYGTTHRETALENLELPCDSRLIVSVHAYLPYSFTLDESGTDRWDAEEDEDTKDIDRLMERLDRLFLKRRIPVVITEFGCKDKDNPEDRMAWAAYYTEAAKEKGIPLVWWDNGKDSQLIDRESLAWTQPELAKLLVRQAVSP